jgi:hypothetical protein
MDFARCIFSELFAFLEEGRFVNWSQEVSLHAGTAVLDVSVVHYVTLDSLEQEFDLLVRCVCCRVAGGLR